MAQDKITEIFDIAALEANKAKFLSTIKETLAEVEKLGIAIKSNTTIGGSSSNGQRASSATKEMESAAKEYTATWKRLLKERDDAEKESRRLEMANTKEVLALRKEVARQESKLRKLEIAGSKEALAIEKELAKQKADLRKLEIAGAKEAIAIQKELEKQEAKEQAIAAKNVFDLANAYDVLNAKHKAAIKEYQNAAAAGKLSAQQLVVLKDNANKLGDQLVKIDSAVGNYRRNVGNYSSAWNGLGMSIQQVAREMPNFAQSMQLGFLAISNNLPILADEIQRAKENIAELKAEGKDAPSLFSQIAASVFSWQTVMTIGITLLVKYGAEIADWVMQVSDAEKMLRKYESALTDSIKSESDGISKLYSAKQVINDTTKSREEQNKALNIAIKEYPEYLQGLSLESDSLEEINTLLDLQIERRIENARQVAINNTIKDSTNELILAQQNLNKEYSTWEQFTSFFTTMGLTMNDLTDDAKNLVKEYQNLNVLQGKDASLSNEQADKVLQLSNATKNLTESIKLQSDGLVVQRDILAKKIAQNEQEIRSSEGVVKIGGSVTDYRKKEREQLELNNITLLARLNLIDDEIRKKKQLAGVDERLLKDGKDGLELLELRAKALNAKDQSKEEIAAKEAVYRKEAEIEKKQLAAQYLNAAKNEEFKKRELLIEAELQQKLEDLRNPKRRGAGAGRGTDTSSFDAKKRLIQAEADLDRELYQQRIEQNKAIVDNENEIASRRVFAAQTIEDEKLKQIRRTKDETIRLLENEESAIAKIEARGAKTSEEKKRVSENNKQAILVEKQVALEKYLQEAQNVENETNKEITKIYEQETKKQIALINGRLDATINSGNAEKRAAQKLLDERFQSGEIALKDYKLQSFKLEQEYNNKTIDAQIDLLKKEAYNITLSAENKAKILNKIDDLEEQHRKNQLSEDIKTAEEQKRTQDAKYKYIQDLANETANLVFSLMDAQSQKEIEELEKRSAALTEKYDLERSAIENASISDKEKTARKLVLDAEEKESQKQIDKEIRAIKRKQAILDKAQALATIATNTAIALSNPLNLASFGSISPFIIALGAAQAATVLATPIPEYAKGKKESDSYEGLAIAGEKGTEMRIDKTGRLEILDKPTLIYTKRGDTILSNDQLKKGAAEKYVGEKVNYDELIRAYNYNADRTIKAIKSSPANIIIDNSEYNLNIKRARA